MTKTATKVPQKKRRQLTSRAVRFCELVAKGNTLTEAYRVAYKQPNLLPEDAGNRGCKVMANPQVKARIEWLRHQSEAKTLLSINDRLGLLAKSAQMPALTAAERSAQARVIEVYNKLAGGEAPIRHEVAGPEGAPIQVHTTVTRITTLPVKQRLAMLVQAKKDRDAQNQV